MILYYITFGQSEHIIKASNPYHACLQVLKKYSETEFSVLPVSFRVSKHNFYDTIDIELINTEIIIRLRLLASEENMYGCMVKYYVRSGEFEYIVMADSPETAAKIAISKYTQGEELDRFVYVDERGFRGPTLKNPELITDLLPDFCLQLGLLFPELSSDWEGEGDLL